MIEFEEGANDIRSQLFEVQAHTKLIRALANFHVDKDAHNLDDIENQREQLLQEIRRLQTRLGRLQNSLVPGEAGPETETREMELLDRFIEETIARESRDNWNPDDFTGSLHVFIVEGDIDSCSLIPKKDLHSPPVFTEEDGKEADSDKVRVVEADDRAFSVLETPSDKYVNIHFILSEAAFVMIDIYDEDDRLVRHIENLYNHSGEYSVRWDGCDDNGQEVPKGKYFCQLQIGEDLTEVKSFSLS